MKGDKYILAYDHGTSGMKTAIVSTRGKVMGFTVEEYGVYYPEKGAAEQDPTEWWAALVKTTRDLLAKQLVPLEDIIAVTTSNQMSGTIPVDAEGNILCCGQGGKGCMTWLDTRGAPMVKNVVKGLIEISGYGVTNLLKWIPRTGGAPGLAGKDCIGHILWIKEKHPDIYRKTWKFLDCKDYLTYRLTGEVVTSYDCGILLWVVNDEDPNDIHYDQKLLKKTKLDVEKLPALKPATHVCGPLLPEIVEELGLLESTKVVLGAGDMAAASIGSGQVLDSAAHVCIGSSSWIVAHIPERKVDIFHMVASLPSAIPGRYMALGEQEAAGINLTWLRDNILYHKDELLQDEDVPDVYKIFDKMAEEIPPGANKLIFTPWLFGERTPVEDHTIRGGLYNVGLDTDRRHLIRAMFEGVAYNSRWLMMYLEKMVQKVDPDCYFEPITIIGGGANSDVWCQIYADVLGRTIRQVANPKEANSIGAAFIASVALDYIDWAEINDLIQVKQEFRPRKKYQAIYDELFQEFQAIYANNKKMFRRLNA